MRRAFALDFGSHRCAASASPGSRRFASLGSGKTWTPEHAESDLTRRRLVPIRGPSRSGMTGIIERWAAAGQDCSVVQHEHLRHGSAVVSRRQANALSTQADNGQCGPLLWNPSLVNLDNPLLRSVPAVPPPASIRAWRECRLTADPRGRRPTPARSMHADSWAQCVQSEPVSVRTVQRPWKYWVPPASFRSAIARHHPEG